MEFTEVVSSKLLYVLVSLTIAFIFILAFLFSRKSLVRARQLNIPRATLLKVVKTSLLASIVPSVAIIIGLFALAPILGIPWPWLRLSVVGSVTYELMAADMAAKGMGIQLANLADVGIKPFVNVMFVMTAGTTAGLLFLFFFGSKIQHTMLSLGKSKNSFGIIALECFMIGLMATFLPSFLTQGAVTALTFLTSVVLTLIQALIVKKYKIMWLKDFILAFSLTLGMASSLLWTSLINQEFPV